jgi:hypothetical protein
VTRRLGLALVTLAAGAALLLATTAPVPVLIALILLLAGVAQLVALAATPDFLAGDVDGR